MSNNTLTHYTTTTIKNPLLLAEHFAKSGYFAETKDISRALVKIIAGQELGFGPMASMSGFHIISGKPTLSANLMAAAIKRSCKYNFKVRELTDKICSIEFFEDKESCGISTFTIEEAKKAQTKNLDKYPKNMLYARALSNGAKWYCPDILNGSPIYTPEELGAEVDEEGELIEQKAKTPQELIIEGGQILLEKLEKNEPQDFEICQKWILKNEKFLGTEMSTKLLEKLIEKSSVVEISIDKITDEELAGFEPFSKLEIGDIA